MRRPIFLALGLLELVVALVLLNLGCQLPRTEEVERSFQSAERVTDRAGTQVKLLRQQVDAGQEFRKQVESYWQACEQWADAQLDEAASETEAAKKGGSKRRSRARSSPRSKR